MYLEAEYLYEKLDKQLDAKGKQQLDVKEKEPSIDDYMQYDKSYLAQLAIKYEKPNANRIMSQGIMSLVTVNISDYMLRDKLSLAKSVMKHEIGITQIVESTHYELYENMAEREKYLVELHHKEQQEKEDCQKEYKELKEKYNNLSEVLSKIANNIIMLKDKYDETHNMINK
jgi:hypothetical protein